MRQAAKQSKRAHWRGTILSLLVFLVVFVAFVFAISSFSTDASTEGATATQNAIQNAAVLCYATEGFYPPSLEYIETHYRVKVDHTRYAVHYDAYAPGLLPSIKVVPRST
ncbi:hypothetical protein LJC04_01695 [Ruminococcaceae bacterium OttesenSCG-928-O06]|nr:hypothetical protein [Ruminococcaceae bacterium OttesenSCG-928-O06]